MENSANIAILLQLLKKLEQPYVYSGNTLIISPTSSPMLEILPGEWVDTEISTDLYLDLTTFDTFDYIANTFKSFAETI